MFVSRSETRKIELAQLFGNIELLSITPKERVISNCKYAAALKARNGLELWKKLLINSPTSSKLSPNKETISGSKTSTMSLEACYEKFNENIKLLKEVKIKDITPASLERNVYHTSSKSLLKKKKPYAASIPAPSPRTSPQASPPLSSSPPTIDTDSQSPLTHKRPAFFPFILHRFISS
jgi:hypothetical protein